jgi:plastocyanin
MARNVLTGVCFLSSFALFGAVLLLADATAADSASPKEVVCDGHKFLVNGKENESLTIRVGDSVVWVNKDEDDHTATSDNDSKSKFDEVQIPANGKSKPVKFTTAGTYAYHCKPHPKMKGVIIVKE